MAAKLLRSTSLKVETMKFRPATIDDVHHITRFVTMAYGGCIEAIYDGLIPDQSIESILEPQYLRAGTTAFYENHWIAEQNDQVAGGVHAFPFDQFANDTPDPRVPEERYVVLQPFANLPAEGTYFVNALSVYPEYGRKGIGSSLLTLACEHAKEKMFTEISLHVYGGNVRAVKMYEKFGFKIAGREPVVEHPRIPFTGEAYLMIASL